MKKKGKIIAIVTTIGVFLIPIIQNVISHKIEDINFFRELKKIFITIINIIKNIITFKIPIWLILIVIITAIVIIKIYLYLNDRKNKLDNMEQEWDKYYTQEYNGLLYTWKQENFQGQKRITDLKPICKCGCDLIEKNSYNNHHSSQGYLVCPNCNKGYINNFRENEQAVINIIVYNYNRMIKEYIEKNNANKIIEIDKLSKKEKEVLKEFYIPELGKYTNRKRAN